MGQGEQIAQTGIFCFAGDEELLLIQDLQTADPGIVRSEIIHCGFCCEGTEVFRSFHIVPQDPVRGGVQSAVGETEQGEDHIPACDFPGCFVRETRRLLKVQIIPQGAEITFSIFLKNRHFPEHCRFQFVFTGTVLILHERIIKCCTDAECGGVCSKGRVKGRDHSAEAHNHMIFHAFFLIAASTEAYGKQNQKKEAEMCH